MKPTSRVAGLILSSCLVTGFISSSVAQQSRSIDDRIQQFNAEAKADLDVVDLLGAAIAKDDYVREHLIAEFRKGEMSSAERDKFIAQTRSTIDAVDHQNTEVLKSAMQRYSLRQLYGLSRGTAVALMSLISHSDDNELQKRALDEYRGLLKDGVIKSDVYANLYDGVAINAGRLPRYGTKVNCVDGKNQPQEVEDPAHLDQIRAEIGLPPMSEFLKVVEKFYGPCPKT